MVEKASEGSATMAGGDEARKECERTDDGHIPFEGLPNTRDMGGIAGADGRRVVCGKLLRSGALDGATSHDLDLLRDGYRLRTVVDLRTEEERRKKPDPEDALPDVRFVDAPILNPASLGIAKEGGIKGLAEAMLTIEGHPGDLMKRIYVSTMTNEKGQRGFASFFEAVLTTKEGSVLWHCSAGKDRTGIAAALLLHVLGASDDDIMEDYLASNRFLESRTQEIMDALAAHRRCV